MKKLDWGGIAKLYIFFFYFSFLYQMLVYVKLGASTGLRQALLLTLLWLIPILFFPKHTKTISAVIGILLGLTSWIPLAYFSVYRQEFSQSVIYILFESNPAESAEYLQRYFQWWMVPASLAYFSIPYFLWRGLRPVFIPKTYQIAFVCVSALVLGSPFLTKYYLKNRPFEFAFDHLQTRMEPVAPWQLIIGYWKYSQQLDKLDFLLSKAEHLPPLTNLSDKEQGKPSTLVLVIGESTNRHRMGLYGYTRDTTPELDRLREQLLVFKNVVTPRPSTIEALEQVLTFADENNPDLFLEKPNLLHLMKQAGYKTYWITNQQTLTARNTLLTSFSKQADEQVYLNNNRHQNEKSFDEVVIAPFNKVLSDNSDKKFIIIHLLGTHMTYASRYPNSYEKFTDMGGMPQWLDSDQLAIYNAYDNAIAYNDHVVSELIKTYEASQPNGFLIYLSDHGEEVFDDQKYNFAGRNENAPTTNMYDVPFLVWISEKWRNSHNIDRLSRYLDRPYSTSYFIHSFADLAGLDFDGAEKQRSIFNDSYVQTPLLIGDPYRGKLRDLSKDPLENSRLISTRVSVAAKTKHYTLL